MKALRQRAEAAWLASGGPLPANLAGVSPEALRDVLHELQVHQIELELQNEELRRAQDELQAARDDYFDLYDLAPVGYCTLNYQGQIRQANLTAASLLGLPRSALLGWPLSRFVAKEDMESYHRLRQQLYQSEQPQACELRMLRRNAPPLWVHWAGSLAPVADGAQLWRLTLTDASERQQAQQALHESNLALQAQDQRSRADLRALALELTAAEQRERELLAQELHDGLAQLLAAVKIKLASLDAPGRDAAITEIDTLMDAANQSLRLLIQELSPPALFTLGLHSAWNDLFKVLQSSYGLTAQLHHDCQPARLDPAQLTLIYRGVRELLINVAKHSSVKSAVVNLMLTQDRITAAVSDEGCGFDAQKLAEDGSVTGRFGLRSLQRRLTALQGSLDIDSAPGKGTTVVLSLPLADRANLEPHP